MTFEIVLPALGLFATPFLILALGFLRAVVLAWPTMLVLGALHSYVEIVPPLGLLATFWLVFALGLLIPVGASSSSD